MVDDPTASNASEGMEDETTVIVDLGVVVFIWAGVDLLIYIRHLGWWKAVLLDPVLTRWVEVVPFSWSRSSHDLLRT